MRVTARFRLLFNSGWVFARRERIQSVSCQTWTLSYLWRLCSEKRSPCWQAMHFPTSMHTVFASLKFYYVLTSMTCNTVNPYWNTNSVHTSSCRSSVVFLLLSPCVWEWSVHKSVKENVHIWGYGLIRVVPSRSIGLINNAWYDTVENRMLAYLLDILKKLEAFIYVLFFKKKIKGLHQYGTIILRAFCFALLFILPLCQGNKGIPIIIPDLGLLNYCFKVSHSLPNATNENLWLCCFSE